MVGSLDRSLLRTIRSGDLQRLGVFVLVRRGPGLAISRTQPLFARHKHRPSLRFAPRIGSSLEFAIDLRRQFGGHGLCTPSVASGIGGVYYRWRGRTGYLSATVLFVAALLSKPSVVVLPMAIFFVDYLLPVRPLKNTTQRMIPWLVFSLFAIYLTQLAQVDHFVNHVEWWQRPLVMLHNYAFYLQKLVWPLPLSGNYALTPELVVSQINANSIVRLVAVTVAVALAYRFDRRYFIGILFLIFILPVSGIIPFGFEKISGVADHYVYLAMGGMAAVLMLAYDFIERKKMALIAIPILIAAGWAYLSFERTSVWKSDQTFFADMAKSAPDSYSTAMGMSVVMCEDLKDYDGGLKWLDVALKAQPNDILALANRAFCLLNAGRLKDTVELDAYLINMDHDLMARNQPTAYSSLISSIGTARIRNGDYALGFEYLCEAYRVLPSDKNHVSNLQAAANILRQQGIEPSCEEDQGQEAEPEEPAPED